MAVHGYIRHGRTPGNPAHCSAAGGPGGHRAAHARMLLGFGTGGIRSAKEDQAGVDWAKGGCGMGLEGPWGQTPNSLWPQLPHGGMTLPRCSKCPWGGSDYDLMVPKTLLGSQYGY